MTSKEIENAVASYLESANVVFSVALAEKGARDENGWEHDLWKASLRREGHKPALYPTKFRTGAGHRDKFGRPTRPSAASVLYCLLSDARGAEVNFYDWCDEYGYDSDSRKALAVYEACCETLAGLRAVLTAKERDELEKLLEDY